MNSRDRVRAALTCRTPDRIPMALAFWEESLTAIAPRTPAEHFGLDVRFVEFTPPADQQDFIHYLSGLPHDVHVGDLAQLRTYHEWRYHPELGPDGPLGSATSADELARHVFPDLVDPRRYAGLGAQVEQWHAQGWAVAGSPPHLGGELFESGYRLRGFINFLADLVCNKPLAHYLLDQLTALMLHSALILARAGVDILLLDDDVAMPTGLIIATLPLPRRSPPPDRIPMALAFWEESLPAIAPRPGRAFRTGCPVRRVLPTRRSASLLHYLAAASRCHVAIWRSSAPTRMALSSELGRTARWAAWSAAELARYTFPDLSIRGATPLRRRSSMARARLGCRRQPATPGRRVIRKRLPPAWIHQLPG